MSRLWHDAAWRWTTAPGLLGLTAAVLMVSCGGGGANPTGAAGSGPAILDFSADALALQEGQATTLHASFTGGSGVIDGGVGPVTSGAAVSVAPAEDRRYTLTVSTADGRQVQRSLDLHIVQDLAWEFNDGAGWTFAAEPSDLASATTTAGALTLWAAAGWDATTGVVCGQVSASTVFGDSRLRAGRYTQLSLSMNVLAWDLGLGRLDTHIPELSLTYAGQRVSFPVSGFTAMPAVARIEWGTPSRLYLDDRLVASAAPTVVAADAEPEVRLQADGCSEGLSQRLVIDRISVAAR